MLFFHTFTTTSVNLIPLCEFNTLVNLIGSNVNLIPLLIGGFCFPYIMRA